MHASFRLALCVACTAIIAACAGRPPADRPPALHGETGMDSIANGGTTWTASTWAYSTPKLLYDGRRTFAVGLVGKGPGEDVARLYWREGSGPWHRGADIAPVYQPATILLDSEGRINLFCTSRGGRGFHWRSTLPGDASSFDAIPLPEPEKFAYGYLGVGRGGERLVLVGLDTQYAMWIAVKPSSAEPWQAPQPLAPSRLGALPRISPTYPTVFVDGDLVHVTYSNCPDGGAGNTYNRVEYARYDAARRQVVRRDVIAEGPVGEVTYGLDALPAPDGTLYVLYTAGSFWKYGEEHAGVEGRKGLYCAVLDADGEWRSHRITEATGTGQLFLDDQHRLHVFRSARDGVDHYLCADRGRTWTLQPKDPTWTGPGRFLYVVKSNSGSVMDGKLRAIQSVKGDPAPESPAGWAIQYIERDVTEQR